MTTEPQNATLALLDAIKARLGNFPGFVLEEAKTRAWSSGHFKGARHEIAFRLEGKGAAQASMQLGDMRPYDYDLEGHLIGEIPLVSKEWGLDHISIRLEALTVEEEAKS